MDDVKLVDALRFLAPLQRGNDPKDTAARVRALEDAADTITRLTARAEKAEADRERLREALDKIASGNVYAGGGLIEPRYATYERTARQALAETPDHDSAVRALLAERGEG